MPNSDFPNHDNKDNSNTWGGILEIFNIGGIKIPQGNTLAIWFLVVSVIAIAFLGYGFWTVIDRILDSKLGPDQPNSPQIIQKDYNNLLKEKESLEVVNKMIMDSLETYKQEIILETDSKIYEETKPYINNIYKNQKK